MKFGRKWRVGAFVGALTASAALITAATGATGAYFNDTQSGTVTGNIGSIKVTTSGGGGANNLDFNFANMMPGVYQTATVQYANTGKNAEDVYLVFNNAEALHSVNNLGHYGEAIIKNDNSTLFASTNLADGLTAALTPLPPPHCTPTSLSPSGCWPIPDIVKLASNVAPGQGGTMSFSFALGPKWSGTAAELAQFFCYPLVQNPADLANPADQVCTSSGPSYGLPYEIVATQPGIAPNNPLNSNPTP